MLFQVSKMSCEEFNRKIFALLDLVKTLEYKYQVLDPLRLTKDPDYATLGPIAILSTLQHSYGRLIATHDWPAVAYHIPQGNHSMTTSNIQMKSTPNAPKSTFGTMIQCFICQENHHVQDCPKKLNSGPTKSTSGMEAWKYIEPKDLTSSIIDKQERTWRFCTKCKCCFTKRTGLYTLSHSDSEHIDYKPSVTSTPEQKPPEGNNASSSDLEQIGVWCSEVSTALTEEHDINPKLFDPELYSTIFAFPSQSLKCPVIFDTGASLAITPHITDFIGPLSTSSVHLKLGEWLMGWRLRVLD
jgi:hypothetical protein